MWHYAIIMHTNLSTSQDFTFFFFFHKAGPIKYVDIQWSRKLFQRGIPTCTVNLIINILWIETYRYVSNEKKVQGGPKIHTGIQKKDLQEEIKEIYTQSTLSAWLKSSKEQYWELESTCKKFLSRVFLARVCAPYNPWSYKQKYIWRAMKFIVQWQSPGT